MSDRQRIRGVHHVTAIAGDPQRTHDFYRRLLGLRLVKKTVNFDDPGTYHLYFGDEAGRPGTLLTFFPWPGARRGRGGRGQAVATALSVPPGSLPGWARRLTAAGVPHEEPAHRFDERYLRLLDPDGLQLELVEDVNALERAPWTDGPLGEDLAIRGIHGVALSEPALEPTAALLTEVFGARSAGASGARFRFHLADAEIGTRIDLLDRPQEEPGVIAAGTVHHVAFRVADDAAQEARREELIDRGLQVTRVLDRRYFRSIYFREPGGVLFEIATDPPGFARDEPIESLGTRLVLPPWLETERRAIEERLPALATTAAEAE